MSRTTRPALLSVLVRPNTVDDARRLAQGLEQLKAEDGNIAVQADQRTNEVVIGGTTELHVEIIIDRLKREFGVEARLGCPDVAYKEVLTRPADGEKKFMNRAAGRAQYAHVKVRFMPAVAGGFSRWRIATARP